VEKKKAGKKGTLKQWEEEELQPEDTRTRDGEKKLARRKLNELVYAQNLHSQKKREEGIGAPRKKKGERLRRHGERERHRKRG